MILKVKEFQDSCKKILEAVDTTTSNLVNETLELVAENGKLFLNVTNREYYVSVTLNTEVAERFKATVDAKLFLTLISKITTEEVSLTTEQTTLIVKANGTYKLPMIYDVTDLVELPKIDIINETSRFNINGDILQSILTFNSKELNKNIILKPVQKMYYLDQEGCITFTTGACVNSFNLDQPIKLLLNQKVVKLFKLFNSNVVRFTLGQDLNGSIIQPKIRFETDNISLTAVISNEPALIASVPVQAIRGRASKVYPFTTAIKRESLLAAFNRLMLFSEFKSTTIPGIFKFYSDHVTVFDSNSVNHEDIFYSNTTLSNLDMYEAKLDLNSLKLLLESYDDEFLTLSFGDSQAIVISKGSIKNVIPQI